MKTLQSALEKERPLQVVGVINAYAAILAESAGFNALYLSGAGVANASYGLPDLGFTSLEEVLIDVIRISSVTEKPLLVDADTGWSDAGETARCLAEAGAAGMHLEDQVDAKRCGHRSGKTLVGTEEMADRVKAASEGWTAPGFTIMARTDATAVEGLDGAIGRAKAYVEAGADMIFAEALTDLNQYMDFKKEVGVPVLANITEFGKTPLYTLKELKGADVDLVLYPLSAFRAMNKAAMDVYEHIRSDGTQGNVVNSMQTREELYTYLDYHKYEKEQDEKNQ